MKQDKKRQRIALAALLHDIGKFWQRADVKYDESEILREVYPSKTYTMTVPIYHTGIPKYVHALWTNAFFEKTKTGKHLGLEEREEDTITNLSSNHHKPNNHDEAIISIADRWSSGIDRPDEGEEGISGYKEIKEEYGKDFVRKVAMHSIFDTIDRDYESIEKHHTYPIKALQLDKTIIFPSERKKNSLQRDYQKLWEDFYIEYNQLLDRTKENFDAFYLSLLTLLKKYTWCIPSATNLLPSNVSLFEHLKSTAAIAISLYDYCEAHQEKLSINENHKVSNLPGKDSLLMVCIDVSGIQKFIYDIANKKAATSLKGRSFYIEMLIQNIIDEVIGHADINAYRSNVIYSSGGKAYLILANTDKVKNALEELQKKIAENLFNDHDGRLFVSIGYTSFRYESIPGRIVQGNFIGQNGFLNKLLTDESKVLQRYNINKDAFDLSLLWRSVSDKASERKNRKFEHVLLDNFALFFHEGNEHPIGAKKCSVTGNPILGKIEYLDKDVPVSQLVYGQKEMGKDLRMAQFIEYDDQAKYTTSDLGNRFSLKSSSNDDQSRKIFLNNWPGFARWKGGLGHMFYGGNYQPSTNNNQPKRFEELCKTEDGQDTKLAVLRMDVDNLGQIFINGIQNKSFASYATLSMMLDTFFAGYINTIQASNELYKNHIQILYSGGDDVFAVGRWDAIIDFAKDIRESFRAFVCRDDITISAGISIVHPKYPISKVAMDAGEAEKRAKKYIHIDKDNQIVKRKDAIDVFGETVGWGDEWKEVETLKKKFENYESDTGRALIHNIQSYKVRKDENLKREMRGEEKDLSYIWHSGYQLSRTMERLKDEKAKEFVKSLRKRILHDGTYGEHFLDIAALAARWAEYQLKDKSKDE